MPKFYSYSHIHVRPAYNLTLLNSHSMRHVIICKYVEDFKKSVKIRKDFRGNTNINLREIPIE